MEWNVLRVLSWAFKSIWWNHQAYLPALVLGGECLLRGLGLTLQGACTLQVFSIKSYASSSQTKRSVEEPASRLFTQCTSIVWEQKTSVWELYIANPLRGSNSSFEERERQDERSRMVYCKVALVLEKLRNLVELYFSAMTCRPSLGALSHRDSYGERSLLPENLNFC